jgi:hypothetical protein
MAIYLTKVWGFGEPCGPLQFSMEGWRDRARDELAPGDRVILVGTKGEPTDKDDQGRVLGMMEPTTQVVLSLDFDLPTWDHDFNEQGEYRWPYGLLNRRAWKFPARPPLDEITTRPFGMDAASGIVRLTDDEAARVMRLERQEVELLQPVRARARLEGEEAARRRGAPLPTTTRTGIMHLRRAPAYTYAMAVEGASRIAFKIGWAFDFRARQGDFNLYALPTLGGLRYEARLQHLWGTARAAFKMEQALLRRFDSSRLPANREVVVAVRYDELQAAWIDYLHNSRRSRSAGD